MTVKAVVECCTHKTEYVGDLVDALEDICDDLLHLGDHSLDPSLYVQSGPPCNLDADFLQPCAPELQSRARVLGRYEYHLLRRLFTGTSHPLFLFGPPGSGKSTTLHYLFDQFVVPDARHHCDRTRCPRRRRAVFVEFHQDQFRRVRSAPTARRLLVDEMNSRLESELYADGDENSPPGPLAGDSDLLGFWDWAVAKIRAGGGRDLPCLRRIAPHLRTDPGNAHTTDVRRQLRSTLWRSRLAKLDYMLAACHYLARIRSSPIQPCFYLVLDDVDYASPFVQEELVHLLATRAAPLSLNLVVALREETFLRQFLANVPFEFRRHRGSEAAEVLQKRLDAFLAKNQTATDLRANYPQVESPEDAAIVHAHLTRLSTVVACPPTERHVLATFIRNAMPQLLRGVLLGAQHLIFSRRDFVTAPRLTEHHLLRAFLRYGEDYFPNKHNTPFCNLFHCRASHDNYPLLKSRVLRYLSRIPEPDEQRFDRLAAVVEHLRTFGYPLRAIQDALSDMASPYHQLVFTTDRDWLVGAEIPSLARLYITQAGLQYEEQVRYSLDYISEMMLTCGVDDDRFSGLAHGAYVVERMHAAVRFLSELNEKETSEFGLWLGPDDLSVTEKSARRAAYVKIYGDETLMYRTVPKCWNQLRKIARRTSWGWKDGRAEFERVFKDMASLLIEVGNINDEYQRLNGVITDRALVAEYERANRWSQTGPAQWWSHR